MSTSIVQAKEETTTQESVLVTSYENDGEFGIEFEQSVSPDRLAKFITTYDNGRQNP